MQSRTAGIRGYLSYGLDFGVVLRGSDHDYRGLAGRRIQPSKAVSDGAWLSASRVG